MEETKYPICRFYASWNQDDYKNNGTGFSKMFKHNPTEEELSNTLEKFKKSITDKHTGVEFITLEYKYIEDETWSIQWFNHITLNKFDTDDEALKSFSDFVNRKTELNKQNGHYGDWIDTDNKNPCYCLMGAEDRYRWEVCHCEYCQKGDWTIINH